MYIFHFSSCFNMYLGQIWVEFTTLNNNKYQNERGWQEERLCLAKCHTDLTLSVRISILKFVLYFLCFWVLFIFIILLFTI